MGALAGLKLLVITELDRFDEALTLRIWTELARAAEPGSLAVDLRDHRRGARRLLDLGQRLRDVARDHGQALVVNERLDLALCLGADGIHLGEHGVATARARQLIGETPVVRACHRLEDVAGVDADIALFSPILAARKGNPALGLTALTAAQGLLAKASSARRLFALGGIDATNAGACRRAGASGVAAISGVFAAPDPASLLAALGILR
jgi:thiamine-phosphate pyrophosphorylase